MNYRLLEQALSFYGSRGYVYVSDAPWLVDKEASYATKPPGTEDVKVSNADKHLVASGEQSFIQLMLEGREFKRAMCITPCFRVERYNDYHKPYFMKVELINADDPSRGNLLQMVHDAASFFEKHVTIKIVETTPGSFDIQSKATRSELGSYGIRRYKDFMWIYGTGCAEPRLSLVQADIAGRASGSLT